MCPNGIDGMANSDCVDPDQMYADRMVNVDPDQTATSGAVCSGCTL